MWTNRGGEYHSVSSRKKKIISTITHKEVCAALTLWPTGLRWTPVLHTTVTSNHRDFGPSGYYPSKANLKPRGISDYGK